MLLNRIIARLSKFLKSQKQLGVQASNEMDAIINVCQRYAAQLTAGRVILKLDLNNALNEGSREEARFLL